MRVDELEVETYYDDWGIIYDQMYLDASEKRTKRFLINRNLAEDTSILNHDALAQKVNRSLPREIVSINNEVGWGGKYV